MQAINLEPLLCRGLQKVSRYIAFLSYDNLTLPLGFDPFDAATVIANTDYQLPFTVSRKSKTLELDQEVLYTGTPIDLGDKYRVPMVSIAANVNPPRWNNGVGKSSEAIANNKNRNQYWTRIGREGAAAYITLAQDIADNYPIEGFAFQQRLIYSRQKRPKWQLSAGYNTRCTNASLDYYDDDAGSWVNGANINVNADVVTPRNITPIVGRTRLRLRCIDGPVNNGYIVVSGDPHFSLAGLALYTSVPRFEDYGQFRSAIIYSHPTGMDFNRADISDQLFTYAKQSGNVPYFVCDVGSAGSGATLELVNNPIPYGQYPQVHKCDLNFSS